MQFFVYVIVLACKALNLVVIGVGTVSTLYNNVKRRYVIVQRGHKTIKDLDTRKSISSTTY